MPWHTFMIYIHAHICAISVYWKQNQTKPNEQLNRVEKRHADIMKWVCAVWLILSTAFHAIFFRFLFLFIFVQHFFRPPKAIMQLWWQRIWIEWKSRHHNILIFVSWALSHGVKFELMSIFEPGHKWMYSTFSATFLLFFCGLTVRFISKLCMCVCVCSYSIIPHTDKCVIFAPLLLYWFK